MFQQSLPYYKHHPYDVPRWYQRIGYICWLPQNTRMQQSEKYNPRNTYMHVHEHIKNQGYIIAPPFSWPQLATDVQPGVQQWEPVRWSCSTGYVSVTNTLENQLFPIFQRACRCSRSWFRQNRSLAVTCGHSLRRSLAVTCGLSPLRSLAVTCGHSRSGHLRSLAVTRAAVTCGHLRSLAQRSLAGTRGQLPQRSLGINCARWYFGYARETEGIDAQGRLTASGCKWPRLTSSSCSGCASLAGMERSAWRKMAQIFQAQWRKCVYIFRGCARGSCYYVLFCLSVC